jgi:flagellar protein FlbT
MSGLVLKLSPRERVLINGAVIENGERRSRINIVSPNAHILRLRDAIHPEDAKTPVKRVCYIVQLILSGDADVNVARRQLLTGVEQLSQVFKDQDSREILATATSYVVEGNYYPALKTLRSLLDREERLLAVHPS